MRLIASNPWFDGWETLYSTYPAKEVTRQLRYSKCLACWVKHNFTFPVASKHGMLAYLFLGFQKSGLLGLKTIAVNSQLLQHLPDCTHNGPYQNPKVNS